MNIPHVYVLDVNPAQSYAVADNTPRQCACGATITDQPGAFFRAAQCKLKTWNGKAQR